MSVKTHYAIFDPHNKEKVCQVCGNKLGHHADGWAICPNSDSIAPPALDTARADVSGGTPAEADRYKADASGLRAELDALRGLVVAWVSADDAVAAWFADRTRFPDQWADLAEARDAAEAALRAAVAEQEPPHD